MKKILVPTDLSPIAELGLQLAVEIASRANAEISLINFTRHPWGQSFATTGEVQVKDDFEDDRFTVELLRVNKAKLEALDAKYSQKGVTITHAILDDELKNGVDHYLREEMIDLVVMGTSGEENIRETFSGNRTEQVIEVSTCPVISVRDGFHLNEMNNIVVAINKIEEAHLPTALSTLVEIARIFQSTVHFVHVKSNVSATEEDLSIYFSTLAERAGFSSYKVTIVEGEDAPASVIDYAKSNRAGLIGVLKNSHEGIFRIFSNHFSDRLVKEVGRPVFTFNLKNLS